VSVRAASGGVFSSGCDATYEASGIEPAHCMGCDADPGPVQPVRVCAHARPVINSASIFPSSRKSCLAGAGLLVQEDIAGAMCVWLKTRQGRGE
jgi:hypothetical protein